MYSFIKKKTLPQPTGPYSVSCVDLMTGFSRDGLFFRLHYPAKQQTTNDSRDSGQWIPWIPHDCYTQGLAYVVGLWVFVVRLAMWWYGGKMHIPATNEGKLLPMTERGNRKLPIIIFSHGFGGCRFLCSSILTELASYGYLVASIEHRETSACATYYYKSAAHLDRDLRTWVTHEKLYVGKHHYIERNNQLKYRRDEFIKTLEFLERLDKGEETGNILKLSLDLDEFKGQLDLGQVTAMGHSYGGATALLALATDPRFKQGVILDGWMFPLKEEKILVSQPLLFINSPTFHIASNIAIIGNFLSSPEGAHRQHYIIKHSTHETQTDTPAVLGYWLNWFRTRIDHSLGNTINNYLMLRFLQKYTGISDNKENIDITLKKHHHFVIEGVLPNPAPVRKSFVTSVFM